MKKILFTLFVLSVSSFAQLQNLNGIKICIDPGHGGNNPANDRRIEPDPGIVFWESEGNFQKALLLRPLLQARGATVYLTRETNNYPDDVDPTLTQRWQFANANNVHWFHSIHSNATSGTNTGTNYTLVLLKENISTRQPAFPLAVTMSSMMYNNIRAKNRTASSSGNVSGYPGVYLDYSFYGGTNGGFNLGVLSGLAMPGELSEGSFHNYYPETRRLMNNHYRKGEAYGIYNAFVEYYGIPFDSLGIICGTQKSGTTPINNIVVRLLPLNKVYNGDAFNNGYFFFDSLAPGNYKIVYETPGYSNDTVNVTLVSTVKSVASSSPQNTATNVARNQSIVINFLKAMDTNAVKNAFSISPNVAGSFAWNNERTTMTFTPAAPLQFFSSYTVTLTGYGETRQPTVFVDNTTVSTNTTTANFSMTFQTEQLPPVMILTQPVNGDTAFVVTKQIGLKFSLTMDTASVRTAFSIVPAVEGTWVWSQQNTTILITPKTPLPFNTNYVLTVGAGAKSIYGKAIDANKDSIPGDPFVLAFKTQMNPVSVEGKQQQPYTYSLSQNFPNPFNPTTNIQFSVAAPGPVTLKIFDMLGREVAAPFQGNVEAGNYVIQWDASKFSSGMYVYSMMTGTFTSTKRMMLVK